LKGQANHHGFPIPQLFPHLANVHGSGHSKDQKEKEEVGSDFRCSTHCFALLLKENND
jgi:hypothetical protein